MLIEESQFMPYGPGNRVLDIVRRIHEGKTPQVLTLTALQSLGVPEGNADRVQKSLRFLGLIDAEYALTPDAVRLRKATSDEYQGVLIEVIRGAYEPIFVSYDPATATGIDLNNAFKPYDPPGQRGNMIALFMALSREAGLAPEGSIRRRGRPAKTDKSKERASVAARDPERRTSVQTVPGNSVRGTSKTVALRSGSGEITLTVSVDLYDLEEDDRKFVFDLIDAMKGYEKGALAATLAP